MNKFDLVIYTREDSGSMVVGLEIREYDSQCSVPTLHGFARLCKVVKTFGYQSVWTQTISLPIDEQSLYEQIFETISGYIQMDKITPNIKEWGLREFN